MKKIFTLFAAVLMAGSMMAAPAEQSTNVLSISYNSTMSVLNITTTNDDPYFYFIESVSAFSNRQQGYSNASLIAGINDWMPMLTMAKLVDSFVTTGDATLNPNAEFLFGDNLTVGEEYIIIAVPYADNSFNGNPVYLRFTYVAPAAPTTYTNITIDDTSFDKTYLSSNGIAVVYGANTNATAIFALMYKVNNATTADYTSNSPYRAQLTLINGTDTSTVNMRSFVDFSVTSIGSEEYAMSSHMLGMDGQGYFVTMTFSSAFIVTDTVAVTFEPYYDAQGEGGWTDVTASEGWWQYQGVTEDQSLYVSFSPVYADQVAGTYTLDDMLLDVTYMYDFTTRQTIPFVSLSVVVTDGDGVVTITAEGVCENGIYYVMTCHTVTTPTALENADATAAEVKAQKIIENGQVVIIRDGKRYNVMGAQE